VRVRYLHSEIHSSRAIEIIRIPPNASLMPLWCQPCYAKASDCRKFLVAILDADKEGFLAGRTLLDSDDRAGPPAMWMAEPCSTPTTSRTRWPLAISETERRRVIPSNI